MSEVIILNTLFIILFFCSNIAVKIKMPRELDYSIFLGVVLVYLFMMAFRQDVPDVINYKDTLKDDDILSDADYLKRINSEIKKIKSKVERLNEKGMQLDIYETNRDYPLSPVQ